MAEALKILLADDEPDLLESLRDLLAVVLPGAEVTPAHDGLEALHALEGARFDLIITDFRMPGLTGTELMRRALHVAPGVPTILLTAYGLEVVHEAGPPFAAAILQKPTDVPMLEMTIHKALRGGGGPAYQPWSSRFSMERQPA